MPFETLFLLALCITAVLDIRYRRIPNYMIAIMIMIGLISLAADGFPAQRIIGGIFPAIVLLAFKKQHQTGFGDIKLIMALGLYYGYLPASIILICAMLLISCYSLLLKRKKGKEIKTVPFAPFIAVFCLLLFIKNILPI